MSYLGITGGKILPCRLYIGTGGNIFPLIWLLPLQLCADKGYNEIMKIQGPGNTKAPSKTKKSDKAAEADSSFGDMVSSAPQESAKTPMTQSIAQVDTLLAVQGADNPTERAARKRSRIRSDKILDALDDVRMAMLRGDLTIGHMVDIADVVASHRERISDPGLTSIMDEIDLRAQVELAKMRVATGSKKEN